MRLFGGCCWLFAAAWIPCACAVAVADEGPLTDEQIRFFETKIRPVLANHCFQCHGPEKQKGGLRLDSADTLRKGGSSGPAVIAGEPQNSALIEAVRYQDESLKMPPSEKLSDRQIADLTEWVKRGAPYPASNRGAAESGKIDIEAARDFWSFRPVQDPAIPVVKNGMWPLSNLDLFILEKLDSKELTPVPAADKRTLIRRATFDLIGLPPTPEEIDAFLADESPDAFATVVDRLLASPHYGERWGRHWLDVARYADSNGLDENVAFGNAWRYRDYVVAAFNRDKPYDQFLLEQIAGDLLPSDDVALRHERLIATGFLALGPKVLAEVDEQKMEMDIIDEQVDTLGRAVMGLTLGCARCHDHKFDPIPTEDYYALAGIFKSTRTMEHFKKIARWHENSLGSDQELAAEKAHQQQVDERKAAIQKVVTKAKEALAASRAETSSGAGGSVNEADFSEETKAELKRLRDELKTLEDKAPDVPSAVGVTEGSVTDLAIHIRGSHLTLGQQVARRFPQVVAGMDQPEFNAKESGRLQLAKWLANRSHPLTGRVMVNRIWRWHFGQGLVRSTDNFGNLGEPPSHPELLDWLTCRFIEGNWSIKSLHRLIMLSQTYRTSSAPDARCAELDPENRWLWRGDVRRLEAEEIRDALLFVSGTLDPTAGGSLLNVKNREFVFNHTSRDGTTYDSRRRSLYLPVIRNNVYDVFQLFDFADAAVANGNRATTTVAPQALFMMNSDFVDDAAENLAIRLYGEPESNQAEQIQRLFRIAYGRDASDKELAQARALLANVDGSFGTRALRGWISLCHVVLASNEFVFVR